MKRTSKFMSLLLALSMVCALFVPAMAAAPATNSDLKGKLIILHTNDTHGGDMVSKDSVGTAGVAQLKKDYEAAGAEVLLFSAGDAIQGAPIVNMDKGASEIAFMNAAGYDAMCPGNHEFDFGKDNLTELAKSAKFPILCANLVDKATMKPIFTANKIFTTTSGLKVGVFGLDTPETASKANPKYVEGLKFLQDKELYACAQAQVDELTKAGCELIVCLSHLGIDAGSEPNRSVDVAKNVKGIDLMIDGHSHSDNEEVAAAAGGSNVLNGTLIVSTGTKLANAGVVTYAGGKLDFGYMSPASYTGKSADVDKLVTERNAAVDKELSAVFAKTEVLLDGNRAPGVRTQETNLGDFAADAILWQAREYLGGADKVDAAFTNGGGIRASIKPGDVSMKDMKTVFPFGNAVYTLSITGAQILEMLEANTNNTPTANGGFPQVSGMTFTVDTSVKYANGEKYGDTTYYAPANPGSRVKDVTIGGKPLDLTKTYTLATNDFTAAGGDAYYVLKSAKGYNTTVALEDALVNYTKEVLKGVITAEKYGKSAGRITVKYVGVESGAWYADAARYVMDNAIMTSAGDTGFAPAGTVTRATVFQTLYNMAGKPAVKEAATFTDVAGKWYADAAAWAEDQGLTSGTGTGLFNGDASITRQELAKVFTDYAAMNKILPITAVDMTAFSDASSIAAWAGDSVSSAVSLGILKGSAGKLNPTGTAIRAELAQILKNYSTLKPTYTEKTVSIPVAAQNGVPAHEIPAIVTEPTSAGKHPAVVMLHGTGSDKNEAGGGYAMAAPVMASFGVASIRIDFMGNGESKADYVNYSYTSANIDAKAAADYMAKLDGVDGTKLGVMGWSQGGTNALLAAAAYPDTFKSVVTWAGALDLKGAGLFGTKTFDQAYAEAQKNGYYEMTFEWRAPLHLGTKWFEEVKTTDMLAKVAAIKAPVLAINGDKDTVVPMANAATISKTAPLGNIWIAEGADHTYNIFTGDTTAIANTIAATTEFFYQTLVDGYVELERSIPNGERTIPAVITMPVGASAPVAAVVMNHGHGGSKDENVGFIGVAEALAKSGIASIRMDFPGCGDSTAPFTDNTMTNMISDSNACKDYLLKNFSVDQNKLGIMGYSMGGRIALTLLGQKENPYKAAVLLSASADPGQEMAIRLLGGQAAYDAAYATASKDGYFTFTTQYGQVQNLSKAWFDDMTASAPLKNIASYTGPMLVMHGDKDDVVNDAVNKSIVKAYPKAVETIILGADHGYGFYSDQPDVTAAVENGITDFFRVNLGAKAAASKAA